MELRHSPTRTLHHELITLLYSSALRAGDTAPDRCRLRECVAAEDAFRRFHPAVRSAVAYFESVAPAGPHLSEQGLAAHIGIDPAHLGRLLAANTGLRYRQWRCGARFRVALRKVLTTGEYVGQIAAQSGWSSIGQFDRDFRMMFGVAPRQLRSRFEALERGRRAL